MDNLSQIKLPNGKTYDLKDTTARDRAPYFVVGTQKASTGSWTGVLSEVAALYDGLTILYYLPYAGNGNATLTLTLSTGNTDAIPVYWTATSQATTHYGAGSVILLTYYNNAWRRSDYNSDSHYTTHLFAGTGAAANATTTNGSTKLTAADNSTARDSITIKGTGATTVTSDSSGIITINSSNTDTKVTSAANHYTPATSSGSDQTASASGATAAWGIDVVQGVTLNTDGKGHVTGLSVTSGKIPNNPNTDTKVTSAANHYSPSSASGSDIAASASGASAAWGIDVVKGVTLNTDGKGHVTGMSVTSGKIPANPNTDTHRVVKVNGTQALASNTTALNLKAGSNVSITDEGSGVITFAATDTTYSNQAAVSGGNTVSLVTTGEKYTWNNKANTSTATTSANGLMASVDKSKMDNMAMITYGVCSTAAATAAKDVTISNANWQLKVGSVIGIKFTNSNTASNVTLNVNGSGAKSIYYDHAVYTSNSNSICGYANRLTYYMYDGTYWVWMNMGVLDGNTNTYPSVQCETAAATAAKVGTCTNFALMAKSWMLFNIRYANSVAGAITMNVNGTGAKAIYINGSASSTTNYTLPAGSYLAYYDGTNWQFRTDGRLPGDAATVNGHTVNANVPSGAKFTDTTYSAATTSANGLMSSTDKSKLDGITASADAVSFTSSLTSGTKIGTININGTDTHLYCQTNTDTKVTSSANHYTPSTVDGGDKSASASGASAAWSIDVVKGVTLNTDGKGHVTGISVTSGKIPSNPNTNFVTHLYAGSGTAANSATTNGNTKLTVVDNSTVRDTVLIKGTGATSVTSDTDGVITINSTDTNTTYTNKAAASGGTDVSLVTTGEKYTWNNKTSNVGTVTSVGTGVGLSGGTFTVSGTIKANLRSETKLTNDSVAATETSNRIYPVAVDKSGYLAVNVPWVDTDTNTNYYHTTGSWSGLTYTATANGGAGALAFTIPTGSTATTVSAGDHTHSNATTSAAGFMSTTQVTKLNNVNTMMKSVTISMSSGATSYTYSDSWVTSATACVATDLITKSLPGTMSWTIANGSVTFTSSAALTAALSFEFMMIKSV